MGGDGAALAGKDSVDVYTSATAYQLGNLARAAQKEGEMDRWWPSTTPNDLAEIRMFYTAGKPSY